MVPLPDARWTLARSLGSLDVVPSVVVPTPQILWVSHPIICDQVANARVEPRFCAGWSR